MVRPELKHILGRPKEGSSSGSGAIASSSTRPSTYSGGYSGGGAGDSSVDLDSSAEFDASTSNYSLPSERLRQPRTGVGSSLNRSGIGSSRPADRYSSRHSTPSPEPSDIDISGSIEHELPSSAYVRQQSAALATRASVGLDRKPSAISSSSSYGNPSRSPVTSSVNRGGGGASRRYEEEDSLEDLNPDNDNEYVPAAISTRYQPAPVTRGTTAPSAAPARRAAIEAAAEEITFDEDSTEDVRASNNTLIAKAREIQEAETRAERERVRAEQEAKEQQRQQDLREAREAEKRRMLAEAAATIAARRKADEDAIKQKEAEERLRRIEEEEEERDRLEAEAAARLRAEAEVDEDYGGEEEFSKDDTSKSTTEKSGLDALDAVLAADEDAEIERARKQLEAEEEAEAEPERKRSLEQPPSVSQSTDDLSLTRNQQLDTQAFTNPPWRTGGQQPPSSSAQQHDASFGDDSHDLEIARRRQEAVEEEAYQRRVAQEKEEHLRRATSVEAAVEESYEEDEFSEPVEETKTNEIKSKSSNNIGTTVPAGPSSIQPSRSGPPSSDVTATAAPSVFAAALASLDPQVAALVMKAVAEQMVAGQQQRSYIPQPLPPTSQRPQTIPSVFDPAQSREAAAEAWEKLLAMRAPTQYTSVPTVSLKPPPFPPTHVPNWEGMMAAVSASQLARTTAEPEKFFTKRPQSFSGSGDAMYPPSSLPLASQPVSSIYASALNYNVKDFNADGSMNRYINRVLHSDLADNRTRTNLRIDSEREALKRLLTFDPYRQPTTTTDSTSADGPSAELSGLVQDQKQLYLQDQAILNSVLRRVLTAGELKQRSNELEGRNQLAFQDPAGSKEPSEQKIADGVRDDGRKLPADDVIRMIEEGYPYAAHDSWQHYSTNTLARSVLLAAEPPTALYTRQVVEATLKETLSEMLSDAKVIEMVKKATLKKLKHRLQFNQTTQPQQHTQRRPTQPHPQTIVAR